MAITHFVMSYPNFVLGQIIDPVEVNQNNSDTSIKINAMVDSVNQSTLDIATANTNALNAVNTSNIANTNATNAVTTANTANTNSTNAVTTANTASTNATTAINTANTATTTANDAKTTALAVQTDYMTQKPLILNAVASVNSKCDVSYVDGVAASFTLGAIPVGSLPLDRLVVDVATQAELDAITTTISNQAVTLKHGQNYIMTDRDTLINNLILSGRTLVNLLGRDGNCEDVSKWTGISGTVALDNVNYVAGSNSIALTSTATGAMALKSSVSYKIDNTKYYLLLGSIKNVSCAGVGNYLTAVKGSDGTGIKLGGTGALINSLEVVIGASFKNVHIKLAPSDLGAETSIYAYASGATTAIGQKLNTDAVSLYQIDQATYNLIDVDPNYTGDNLADKFPYVDSYQVLQNPEITVQGKNFLPPFSDGNLSPTGPTSTTIAVNSPYSMQMVVTDATAESQIFIMIPALPNTQYTITNTSGNGFIRSSTVIDSVYTTLVPTKNVVSSGQSVTFTAPSDTKFVRINFTNSPNIDSSGATVGTFTFTNPVLNLGSTALPFEVATPSYEYFPVKLADNESLQQIAGKWNKTKLVQDVVLDGSLGWVITNSYTGFKRVNCSQIKDGISTTNPQIVTKYDGKILLNADSSLASDRVAVDTSTLGILISVSSADSGWGDSYTPTVAEIQAYFLGYKMNNGTFGTPYNGSGTKTWTAWNAPDNTGALTTVSSTPSSAITTGVYSYYQLHYTLATPTTEIVVPEGAIELHDGANQVELGEGVVVRESVIPYLGSDNKYRINNKYLASGATSMFLKNRADSLLSVYKNGVLDPNWLLTRTSDVNDNGIASALISAALYDPTASYSVTYQILDKYLFTTNSLSQSATYSTNDHTVLQEVVREVDDVETRVSVLEITKANRQQPQWIAPTLLNGWVNFGAPASTIGYFKDEMGFVHVKGKIKSGTIGANALIFLVGYRPLENHTITTTSNGVYGNFNILPDGSLLTIAGSNVSFDLDCTFLAEQ